MNIYNSSAKYYFMKVYAYVLIVRSSFIPSKTNFGFQVAKERESTFYRVTHFLIMNYKTLLKICNK